MLGTTMQKVTLWAVMATADRATCNTRAHAPLIDQAVVLLVSSLFNNLVNVIFMFTCVSIKFDSAAHFLVYQILNYVLHTTLCDTHNHVRAETTLCSAPRRRRLYMLCGALQLYA